jgi:hypothetical protein
MNNCFKKVNGLLFVILSLNFMLTSIAQAKDLSDEDFGNLVKAIMVKNQIVTEESQISSVQVEYTMASAAADLANIGNQDSQIYGRKVKFQADLEQSLGQIRNYTCNLTVKIQDRSDYSGTQLSSCEFKVAENIILTY